MSARIIDGKTAAAELRGRVAQEVLRMREAGGVVPGLAVVLVGDNPASEIYVRNKARQTAACGMNGIEHRLPADVPVDSLLSLIHALNADPAVHGILVQLPLPGHIDPQAVIDAIDPDKDVDGFHPLNAGRLATGRPAFVPCTPLGCLMLLQPAGGALAGREAVVLGRSNIVGRPMAQLLLAADCTVTLAHSRSRDLPGICRRADILVVAVGRPRMVGADWVKPGATVIDVGINRVTDAHGRAHVVGDVDFDAVRDVAGAITPVPGGVGPMTIACLLANTVTAAARAHGLPVPHWQGI